MSDLVRRAWGSVVAVATAGAECLAVSTGTRRRPYPLPVRIDATSGVLPT